MLPWLFLALSLVGALYTLNAFVPVRRNRLLFLWSFVSSWITAEGALVHVAWQALVTAAFVAGGALEAWPGWVGLGICAASWTGLVVLHLQGRGAAAVVGSALADLGDDLFPAHPRRPGRRETRRVRRTRDVEFARVGGRRLRLDVFEPATTPAPGQRRPAVVQLHGGAWVMGFKDRQGAPLLRHLAANGWVGFNVDYRLSPAATWPDHLVDCKRAIAWVREHADEYDVDPSFVAVTGGSAGGHLAAMVALTPGDERYQPGFESADTSVQAAVPFYGAYDLTNRSGRFPRELHRWLLEPLVFKAFYEDEPERFEEASPLLLAERQGAVAPPMLVVHGDRDTLTPVADAREFVTHLRACSDAPVVYIELRGAQHAFDTFRSPRTNRVVCGVHRFLEAARTAATSEAAAPAAPGEPGAAPAPRGEPAAEVADAVEGVAEVR